MLLQTCTGQIWVVWVLAIVGLCPQWDGIRTTQSPFLTSFSAVCVSWQLGTKLHCLLQPTFGLLAAARSGHCCTPQLASSVQNLITHSVQCCTGCTAWIKPVLGGGPLWSLTASSLEVKRDHRACPGWRSSLVPHCQFPGSEETIEPVLGGGPLWFVTASWQ